MKWEPEKMLLADVIRPHGGLKGAGLKKIGRKNNLLVLTFSDNAIKNIGPGENIPLPRENELMP